MPPLGPYTFMKTTVPSLLIALALGSWGCAADSVGDGSGAVRVVTDCAVEGFGTLPAGDEFDGVGAGLPDGFAEGTWVHLGPETVVDDGDDDDDELPGEGCRGERRGHHEGRGEGHDRHQGRGLGHGCGCDDDGEPETTRDRFEGTSESVTCFINGSRVGVVQGSGTWNGEAGYTFEVGVVDGGPTNDEYTFTVYDSSGGTVYTVNGFPDTGDLTVTEY